MMQSLMRAVVILGCFLLLPNEAFSQTISIPDTLKGWHKTWVNNLHGSQATYNNWSKGGASSVSGTTSSVFTAINRKERRGYGVRVNLQYGQSHLKDEGFRKTDDVISVRNRLTQTFRDEGRLSSYISGLIQTQFDKGYDYKAGVNESDSLISGFMSPLYFTESMGFAYQPIDYFSMELGVGLKQTYVHDRRLTKNYGFEPGENFRSEGGISAGIDIQKEIFTNIFYSGSLETFTNLLYELKKTDVSWANELKGDVNKMVSVLFQFEMKYDDDYSSKVQLKQILSAGIAFNIY